MSTHYLFALYPLDFTPRGAAFFRVYGQPHERLCSLPVSVLFRVGSAEKTNQEVRVQRLRPRWLLSSHYPIVNEYALTIHRCSDSLNLSVRGPSSPVHRAPTFHLQMCLGSYDHPASGSQPFTGKRMGFHDPMVSWLPSSTGTWAPTTHR